jgi:hypothetical protein
MRLSWVCSRPAVSIRTTSAPHLQLLDGGGAERIAGGEHDGAAHLPRQVPGELAERRRLAGAVDARDEDDRRLGAQIDRVLSRPGDLGEQLDEPVGELLTAGELALGRLLLELGDDLRRRRGTDVGVDERFLQALPGLRREILEERRLDLGLQRLTGLAQALAQASQAARAPLGGRGLLLVRGHRAVDDEQVSPVAGHDGPRG